MRRTLPLLTSVLLLLAGVLSSQSRYPVGYRDLALSNTGAGSKILQVRVFYPATKTGAQTALVTRKAGWPSCVFLHGFDKYGNQYVELGFELASRGFLAFMADTAPKDLGLQIQDAIALHPTLARLDQDKSSFLHGQIRADRLALLGHSTGASNVVHVLAANPGYVCGVSYGPFRGVKLDYTKKAAAKVTVPMLVVGGTGEKITPWKDHVLGLYDELTARLAFREMLLLDDDANHFNIVAWILGTNPRDKEVFTSTQQAVTGFLRANVDGDLSALDQTYGLTVRKEKRVDQIRLDVKDPILFRTGTAAIGQVSDFQLAARPGPTLWLFSLRPATLATQWGTLGLDPLQIAILGINNTGKDHYQNLPLPVPKDPNLKGLVFYFQVAAQGRDGTRFSNTVTLPLAR
jgi:dienelactone hydrolase